RSGVEPCVGQADRSHLPYRCAGDSVLRNHTSRQTHACPTKRTTSENPGSVMVVSTQTSGWRHQYRRAMGLIISRTIPGARVIAQVTRAKTGKVASLETWTTSANAAISRKDSTAHTAVMPNLEVGSLILPI